jgi:hypothetical protein
MLWPGGEVGAALAAVIACHSMVVIGVALCAAHAHGADVCARSWEKAQRISCAPSSELDERAVHIEWPERPTPC